MNKYIIICLGVVLLGLGKLQAMGPFPLPYATYTNISNPANSMTPQQKTHTNQVFGMTENAFIQNHRVCRTRVECLNMDLTTLRNFIYSNPYDVSKPYVQKVYDVINYDEKLQKFTTQWVIYQNLSPQRQREYVQNGIRFVPIQPVNARFVYGNRWITAPANYNRDDALTSLLPIIDRNHKNCVGFTACLAGDRQIIANLVNRLSPSDPLRNFLWNLSTTVYNIAMTSKFNTILYLRLYNPINPDWHDTLLKHKAKKLAGYGYIEWKQVSKASVPRSWHSARMTNGVQATQSQNYVANLTPIDSTPLYGKSVGQWLRDNRDLFRRWW
ncbi:MAG: hypothetical protein K2Y18_03680 [Alphaproteobacteria bacterium]|jgi:hypothetical protein|nr:hypothetical protein [Alphaproteobacteria bacterium]